MTTSTLPLNGVGEAASHGAARPILDATVTPIIVAFVAAILTSLLTHFSARRRKRRRACLNAAALLSGYEEELREGLHFIRKLQEECTLRHESKSFRPIRGLRGMSFPRLPRAFWEDFKLTDETITEIWLLRGSNAQKPYDKVNELPTNLKNCFAHITKNYEGTLAGYLRAIRLGKDFAPSSFQKWIDGYAMTLAQAAYARDLLQTRASWRRFWYM